MLKKVILGLIVVLCFGSQVMAAESKAKPAKAKVVAAPETTLEVKAKLDTFAVEHALRANATLKPRRSSVDVIHDKKTKEYTARFLEVDLNTLTTEIYPGTAKGALYVGHVVYLEKVYECLGRSRDVALAGPYKLIKARRIREITRYDEGKWFY